MRTEAKLFVLACISTSLVWMPKWPVIGGFAVLAVVTFRLARLPRAVIPRLPEVVIYGLLGGAIASAMSGGDPDVLGLPLGGLLDFLRLLSMGVTLIFWAGLLAWTTGITELGAGLSRLVRPLRRIGVPTDELTTVIALGTRSLPLVANELTLVNDAVVSRPFPETDKKYMAKFMHYWGLITDMAVAVVVGSLRRSRDMARAMTVRASTSAPAPLPVKWKVSDLAAMAIALAGAITAVWLGS